MELSTTTYSVTLKSNILWSIQSSWVAMTGKLNYLLFCDSIKYFQVSVLAICLPPRALLQLRVPKVHKYTE